MNTVALTQDANTPKSSPIPANHSYAPHVEKSH
ncbi:hypothetical protein KU39_2p16 (plasmid) [Piscirickettsia salmonis]|uniref:Uncharacterized protein n=1 Tax=Piscirickettsia salmonis TaxID=1238 RepID=A0AAC9EVH1_PISSA|nr:hypothetical protein KU39_2p16 [Piscirickettsia salmonis]